MRLNWQKSCKLVLFAILLCVPFAAYGQSSVLDLNDAIQEKKQAQQDLQRKIDTYNYKVRTTQKKAATLKNQITILDANIAKTGLEIENKKVEAEQLLLEVQLVEQQIVAEENRIGDTLGDIAAVLRRIKRYDDRKYVEIVLAERSFSTVFDQLYYTQRLAGNLKQKLDVIKSIRQTLENNRVLLGGKQTEAEHKTKTLAIMKDSYGQEKRAKRGLFGQTKASEAEFRKLLEELRAAAAAIDSEIVTIEKQLREKLDLADKLAGDTGLLSWPIPPLGGLSAIFHDQDYPYRYLFEHAGIDIRAKQGSPVTAAASGYVAKVKDNAYTIQPSYVMILHGSDLTTVYMHLSSINVAADTFVARGDVIGDSGGAPGTRGAGRWSTGPHLHFETRLKGIPVNPIGYLP